MADADFSVKAIISAQTSQFEKGIKNAQSSINTMSKSIEGVQKLLKSAFSVVGIVTGIKAVTDFGKSCVQSATQAQKAFNILDNTIKATGADAWTSIENLESASKTLSNSTNYSVTEIQKMQSVLLGFTNVTGEAFDEASEAVLDMATVMGMDLTSAVQTIGKALDDPITGLDSLRRQGFKFTDEQKAELAQLVKNGKQLEAQKIILDSLAISYGGAAKAGQDSFAKQRHAIENFSDAFGAKLIPIMQVFAENNAKMIDSLRESIENMDFTPVVNVVTNLKKIFSETFKTISEYLQNAGAYVSDFISRFNFKPIISVLDTLIGVLAGVINKFKEINSQKLEIFDKLKESLIYFSNSETFQNIVNFVNKIIDAVFFLWSEIQDIGTEIRNLIVNKIIEIWNKIKELFQNGQNALSQSGQDIASWGDLFYDILNNTFRSFQDLFGMIKALIHGDWTVAWEYAKLTVMRVADNILDLISTIANAFPNLINGMINELNKLITEINKVRGWFGKDPLGFISAFESVDISKKSGLEDKIKETENKIQELTGNAADIVIKDLQGVSVKFSGFIQNTLGEIKDLTEGSETEIADVKEHYELSFDEVEGKSDKFFKKLKKGFAALKDEIEKDAEDWSDVIGNVYSTLSQTFGDIFTQVGESLVEGGKGFEQYAGMAVKALAQVLKGLGEQLLAIAAVNLATKQYASAAIAAAGAAAAFVASGVLSAVANSMTETSDETKEASDQIERVGNVAITSSYSLEEFVNKLKEIKGLFTGTSVSIMQTYRGLSTATQTAVGEYQKALSAFNEYAKTAEVMVAMRESLRKRFGEKPLLYGILPNLSEEEKQKAIEDRINKILDENVLKTYDELKAKVDEMAEAYRKASLEIVNLTKNTISSYKSTIAENRTVIANYYEVLDAQRKVNELQAKWSSMSASQRQADINKYQSIVSGGVGDITSTITYQLELYRGFVESLLLEQKVNVQALTNAVYTEVSKTGTTIGNTLVKSILSGATKTDFLSSMKDYISETLIQIAIYTESFEDKLAEIGAKLSRALLGLGDTSIQDIRNELENLWDETEAKAKRAGEIVKEVFGDIETNVMVNIKEFGTDISSTLVDSLTNGLGQSGFLDSMKNFIRKMLIQTVVYTDAMKSEIESIGRAISKGLTEGFTDTTFHEIRRDLSWTFDQANRSIENIDSILNSVFGSGYATGTNNATAGLHLVGEAGPELVRFRGGEQVLNAGNTQKALNNAVGTVVNQNVTFNNLQDTTAYAMMNQFKQYNRQMAINGVI